MEEPHSDPRVTFARHRRNLLAVSLVLLAFEWAGATFDTIVILGNTVNLRGPLDITVPLWIAWAYFSLRAYQYYRAIPGSPIAIPFHDRVVDEAASSAKRIAAKELRAEIGTPFKRPSPASLDLHSVMITGYEPAAWVFELRGSATVHESAKTGSKTLTQMLDPYTVRVPTNNLPRCRRRAAWWLTWNTPIVTEYILPAVIAALPPLRFLLGKVLAT